jgi:hypothetical protein
MEEECKVNSCGFADFDRIFLVPTNSSIPIAMNLKLHEFMFSQHVLENNIRIAVSARLSLCLTPHTHRSTSAIHALRKKLAAASESEMFLDANKPT